MPSMNEPTKTPLTWAECYSKTPSRASVVRVTSCVLLPALKKTMMMKLLLALLAASTSSGSKLSSQKNDQIKNQDSYATSTHRELSFQRIVGYEPRSQVTDIAALDLDQRILEEELFLGRLKKAQNIYTQGGHSQSYAYVTIKHQNASFAKGTQVFGLTPLGGEVSGSLMEDVKWPKGQATELGVKILYHTSDVQDRYVGCQVGGLFTFSAANHDGCFNDTGVLTFVGETIAKSLKLPYSYDIRLDNNNGRTLQKISTTAEKTMRKGGDCELCPYFDDYQKFVDYYGDTAYGNTWVTSAFSNSSTDFPTGLGNADFSKFKFNVGFAEAVAKGSAYMIVLMEVIRELEDAISDCETRCDPSECNDAHYYSIDAAVALYAGSLEGQDGSGDGMFLYGLANRRCINFMTCGELSNHLSGTANVNLQVVREMQKAQLGLLQNQCNVARKSKETIVNYIKVPLVQSVLQYAYVRQHENPDFPDDAEQLEAEGASFTAALLPWVHACNPNHASDIYKQMKIGSAAADVDFAKIKRSLESIYPCLGITCGNVGGIHTVNGYYPGAEPCNDGTVIVPVSASKGSEASRNSSGGLIAGALIGSVCAVLLAALYIQRDRENKRKRESNRRVSNIAAVTEIA